MCMHSPLHRRRHAAWHLRIFPSPIAHFAGIDGSPRRHHNDPCTLHKKNVLERRSGGRVAHVNCHHELCCCEIVVSEAEGIVRLGEELFACDVLRFHVVLLLECIKPFNDSPPSSPILAHPILPHPDHSIPILLLRPPHSTPRPLSHLFIMPPHLLALLLFRRRPLSRKFGLRLVARLIL
jgi:hypothetical protein